MRKIWRHGVIAAIIVAWVGGEPRATSAYTQQPGGKTTVGMELPEPVTEAILPELGPVNIVGYHVIIEEAGAEVSPTVDIDLPASETRLTVPDEFLQAGTIYRFEILSTEESGNQTITE